MLCGAALLTREDEESFAFAANHFCKALAYAVPPKLIVLERSNLLRVAIQKAFAGK